MCLCYNTCVQCTCIEHYMTIMLSSSGFQKLTWCCGGFGRERENHHLMPSLSHLHLKWKICTKKVSVHVHTYLSSQNFPSPTVARLLARNWRWASKRHVCCNYFQRLGEFWMHFPQKGASIGHLDALLAKTLTVAFFFFTGISKKISILRSQKGLEFPGG